jgi:hypothetical protein
MGQRFIKVATGENTVRLEAWIPFMPGLSAEIGTVGIWGRVPLQMVIKQLHGLAEALN